MKRIKYILPALTLALAGTAIMSCDDMLDMGNDDMLYADENHLTQGNDTVNSFVGILAQLQKIAVRTNLFGELRGDLTTVNLNANADLKAIANFEVTDDNAYNNPRDYYAVINNCNYYLANADTTLRETAFTNGVKSDFYVFRAEYTAVRAIRAWVYLQLGQIYGENIPLVTQPILSLEDADKALDNAPKKDLVGLCDYFIDDLKPYVPWFTYPYHGNPAYIGYNSEMPSRMAVLPIQLVLGDLYLWSASIHQNPMLAREAAKCYYDYIDWIPTDVGLLNNESYKVKTTTGLDACVWPLSSFTSGNFNLALSVNSLWFSTRSFGRKDSEVIAAIAMDSASSEGHFNELRYLYCYNLEDEKVEASFSPSQACFDYSDSQTYYAVYASGDGFADATIGTGQLTEQQLQRHFLGDLRLPTNISMSQRGQNTFESQMISKAYYPQDVIVYRRGDVYLRMAEALNYAGFPKFALAILTTGLDNTVINGIVLPQCTNALDSAFVEYFDFPTIYYRTRIDMITTVGGVTYSSINRTQDANLISQLGINQMGLHARGSGEAFNNDYYYDPMNDQPADWTGFPEEPPFFVETKGNTAAQKAANIQESNPELIVLAEAAGYAFPQLEDFNSNHEQWGNALDAYQANLSAFADSLYEAWVTAATIWYRDYGIPQVHERQLVVLDSLLDVESALETPFEGFRFGALMRAAYRKGNATYLAEKVARREPSLLGRLSDRRNWFVSWKGQIGK
ncbi:MAG: hypothetical protein J6W75_01140 [Bacteroidaceae bacterium]|nr:hypothetical protein [Bacteroidaceae bacterium]